MTTIQKPRKYHLVTNGYSNLDNFPKGKKWIRFEYAGISRRKSAHRYALDSGRIFTYEVLVDWRGSNRRGWSPILESIIHLDQLPLFNRLVTRYQKDRERVKAKRATNKLAA